MRYTLFNFMKMPCVGKICFLFIFLATLLSQAGCRKFVEIDPPKTGIVSTSVYESDASAAAVLTGIYSRLIENPQGVISGNYSIGYLCGLSADELTNYSTDDNKIQFYTNSLTALRFNYFWSDLYQQIYVTNAAIEGISKSSNLSVAVKEQLLGEARFLRAFFYFYAVNLFGDVPLLLSTDYRQNNVAQRAPISSVYDQIVKDLEEAKSLLTDSYRSASNKVTDERVRPNKGTAVALLARVYLYRQEWQKADNEASELIANSSLYNIAQPLNNVFLKESSEAIWQFQSVYPGANTFDGYFYVLLSPPGSGQYEVSISNELISQFENGDKRLTEWIGSFTTDSITYYHYSNKYKVNALDESVPVTEYTIAFRLAEQYLIRSEARVQLGKIDGALADLNAIRSRAGLSQVTFTTKEEVLAAIYHERQVELFTEWGHRWLDLKRTGLIDAVMNRVAEDKGGSWNTSKQLFPIPATEIQKNSHLNQNNGY